MHQSSLCYSCSSTSQCVLVFKATYVHVCHMENHLVSLIFRLTVFQVSEWARGFWVYGIWGFLQLNCIYIVGYISLEISSIDI